MAVKLKICTFNLRHEIDVDGINNFWNRTARVRETIAAEQPDLIGFQEVTGAMRAWLKEKLTEYTLLAPFFDGDSPVIAYRSAVFELTGFTHFWLSPTPQVPESRFGGDQSKYPRMAVSATLRHHKAAEPICFYNTHLDHKGTIARLLGATQLMQDMSKQPCKVVLTGDFNALPDTPEILTVTACPTMPMTDATAMLGGTFHSFGKKAPGEETKIDYIFTNAACDPTESYIVEDLPADGVYISDHNPVCAYITLA